MAKPWKHHAISANFGASGQDAATATVQEISASWYVESGYSCA
jgi:hypothetical protein